MRSRTEGMQVHLTWHPQVGVHGGAAIYTVGSSVRPREVHDDPSEVTMFRGPGE